MSEKQQEEIRRLKHQIKLNEYKMGRVRYAKDVLAASKARKVSMSVVLRECLAQLKAGDAE